MSDDLSSPDRGMDRLLPLGGPYDPDGVAEAARTIAELVRRLNHATVHSSALRYPPHVHRTVEALRSALHGLRQTFTQIAVRLDGLGADPRVGHDSGADPAAACAEAASQLRQAADALSAVTDPLAKAERVTYPLGYANTRRGPFATPTGPDVHKGQASPGPVADMPAPLPSRPRRAR